MKATIKSESLPWAELKPPEMSSQLSGRRVATESSWDLYWAIDHSRRPMLVLHLSELPDGIALPKIRHLEIVKSPEEGSPFLAMRLIETSLSDLFHSLCNDIINAVEAIGSEEEAATVFVRRAWRWQRLLSKGADGKLTSEEQKGLIGELLVLKDVLMENLKPEEAIASWTGPLGAPKDFELGRICIEAKCRRGGARPHVAISSEYQLDTAAIDRLFLIVVDVFSCSSSSAPEQGAEEVRSITDHAQAIRRIIEKTSNSALDVFESRLAACGFDWFDDYSDSLWVVGDITAFDVSESFPALSSMDLPVGVRDVKYNLDLNACVGHVVEIDEVIKSVGELK